jgi:streptogramin lyase
MDPGYDGDNGPALLAKLTTPFAVLPTNDGGFYISDVDAHVIRYVDPAGTISTVAGTGTFGYAGDGATAVAATLKSPTRMRRDSAGNLYFCDTNSHVIRRIDLAGVITTVAGTGVMGYSGDHGLATAARFNTPYDLRFAPNGDLYIADTGNNVIRRIDHNGVVTTVVGIGIGGFAGDLGDAHNARLNRPSALTFDADGALWISDTSNQRVRRVTNFLSTQQ